MKTLSTWPATPGTRMATLSPCKQRPQQAGVGDRMETTPPMMATTAFDLPLQQAMDWGSTTSLGIRLWTKSSSGGCFYTIKWKPQWLFSLFTFMICFTWLMVVCQSVVWCCTAFHHSSNHDKYQVKLSFEWHDDYAASQLIIHHPSQWWYYLIPVTNNMCDHNWSSDYKF